MSAERSGQFSTEILTIVDTHWWNELVARQIDGTLFQTAHWAHFQNEYMNYDPLYLLVRDKYGNVAGFLLFFRTASNHYIYFERPFDQFTIPFLKRMVPEYIWMDGPIVLDKNSHDEVIDVVQRAILNFSKTDGGVMISRGRFPLRDTIGAKKKMDGFQSKPWSTFLIDLSYEEEALWQNLKQSARKAIKHAQQDGIVVEQISNLDELFQYHQFSSECLRKRGSRVFSFNEMSLMWKHLRPHKGLEIFVAKHQGETIASLGIWAYNGNLLEWGALKSLSSVDKKYFGGDLIKWEVIKWGHKQGYRMYDLAGISPEASTKKEMNILQFKEKWGGERVDFLYQSKVLKASQKICFDFLSRVIGRFVN